MTLTEDQTDLIVEEIRPLLCHYQYNSQGSDYHCIFCYEFEPIKGEINHKSDCAGLKILETLGENIDRYRKRT